MSAKDKAIKNGMKYREDNVFIELFDEKIIKDKAFITIDKQDKFIYIESDDNSDSDHIPALLDKEQFEILIEFTKELNWFVEDEEE